MCQKGSRMLQKSLGLFSSSDISNLFQLIYPKLSVIVVNSFGNYFCQKFFNKLDFNQRSLIWDFFNNNLIYYATQEYGNRCYQAMIDLVDNEQEEDKIINIVYPYFRELAYNQFGTYVLQKIILKFSAKGKQKLVLFIKENISTLACDAQGVCILKKYIINIKSKEDVNSMNDFNNLIYQWIPKLCNDAFGNYAILCMFEEWGLNACDRIVKIFYKNIAIYSSQKFASSLISKILELLPSKVR